MSYSSLPFSSKLFQLTSLTCALALAGCGGGDGTDTIAPAPDLGVQPGTGDGNGDNGGGDDGGDVETPVEQPFNLQKLYTTPTSIKLGDEPVTFTVTVKAVENATGAAAANKPVSLSVEDSQSNGVTIQGESTQTTDARGEATYELKLNPLVLSAEQKTALLTNGFSLTASADRAGSDIPVTQLLTVSVSKEGSGEGTPTEVSDLNIESSLQTTSVSNNEINPYGDMVAFSVVLKNTDGARAEGVTVGMAIADVKGIAIVGGNNKTTDENGVATFALKVNEGLTKTERDALLKGVVYAINIAEDSGATKKATGTLPVSLPVSDYKLAISGNASAINAYGDTQRLTINASAINNAVPTSIDGAKASIKLNNTITGVSLSTETLTFNANGQALADIIVAPTLSAAERTQLAKDGISYTVTLSEPNRATTVKTAQSRVEIPQAQYQIKADSTSKARISSFGSSVVISFRVNDKDGGAVAGQKVIASLPSTLTQKGLLNLDSAANQVTDAKGEISYTVSIPKGLSADDRALLENAGGFVLTAQAIETSGASSQISSSRIQVTAESETILSAKSTPSAVNVLKDQFSIQVAAKRPNGSAASDKEVTLTIDNVAGVSIEGNKQTTDASGAVSFTINLDQNMSAAARNALVKSGIPYTVTLTDDDGVTTEAYKATVIMPVAEYQINTTAVSQDKLLSTGDDTTISFRVNDKNGGVIAGQTVTASLPSSLTKSGLVTLKSAASQQTDAQGMVSYTVSIPEGLSAQQRAALEASGFVLSAALTESSGVTIKKDSKRIAVNADPSRSTTLVTAKSIPGVINVLQDQFSIQIAAKRPNGSAAADKPVELIINDIKGISIAGNKKTTNSAGVATFTVNIDPSLSLDEREALAASGIAYQAILTDDDGVAIESYQAAAAVPTAQYAISFGQMSSTQLSSMGGTTTVSFRVNDKDGGVIAGQRVTARLPQSLVDAGVLTLDDSASQTTDSKGTVSFNVRVPTGLNAEQKALLENNSGFVLSVKALEASGASSTTGVAIDVTNKVQQSKTVLKSQSTPATVNILKDSFTIQVSGKRPDGSSAADKVVKLTLGNVTGLSVQDKEQTTDSAGNAVFTVNIDPSLDLEARKKIAQSGIAYTAILTDDDGITEQNFKAAAVVPAAQYKISFGQLSSTQLSSAGGTTTVSFRVNDKNGGVIAGQNVTAILPSALVKAGLLTLDGSTTQTTDDTGMVSFTVRVPTGLSAAQKTNLEKQSGFVLTARVVEASGASTTSPSTSIGVTSKAQVSKTTLRTQSSPKTINILKDSFTIQVAGERPDGSAAANKVVKLTLGNATDFSVKDDEQTTDNAGNTTFTVSIDPALTQAQREALVASGLNYTVSLTDDDGVATSTFNAPIIIPTAQYQINFGQLSNTQLSSSGGSTVISFRVNDKNGGTVAGQTVTAALPENLVGLLILDGSANQTTDDAGMVSFTVRIPAGLSATQKAALEKQSSFVLSAKALETSGASSKVDSRAISISDQVAVSKTSVSSSTVPSVVNVLKNQFEIQVSGKRVDGSAAADKAVKLIVKDVTGISVQGNEQRTDSAGNATFIINIDPNLTPAQREKLAADGIRYTAILTDNDGIAEEDFTVAATIPDAQYNINVSPSSSNQIASSGGSVVVSFRVTDKSGGAIPNQNITASLPKALTDAGLLAFNNSAAQTTNAQGVVNYTVSVPNNLNAAQKKQLEDAKGFKVNAVLTENSGARTAVDSQNIDINASSKTALTSNSTPSVINVLKDTFTIQVSGKRPDGSAAADKVVKLNLADITGLSIAGSEQTTNASGVATFTVNIDPSLTRAQREALVASGIAYTAILIDDDGIKEQTFTTTAEVPAAQYQISFGSSSNTQLSSSGGSTVISFRVNDKNGGVIAGQPVTVSLPDNLAGLLTLDSNATKPTNEQGEVSFTVRVPTGLSAAQKAKIEQAGQFSLTAVTVEASEAKSEAKSGLITLSDKVGQSSIQLVNNSSQPVLTTDKQFVVTITGKYPDSSAAADRAVKLELNQPELFTIVDANQNTDKAGNVSFTINIKDNLSEQEINALVVSGISYTATIIDNDGTQAQVDGKIKVAKPATTLSFASVITPSISEFGGEGVIKVQLLNSQTNKAAQNQAVSILLGKKAQDYGVTVNQASNTTDFNGETTFIVSIPEGLSSEQRDELQEVGINYQLSYVEKGETYTSEIQQVTITTPAVDLTVLNNPNLINNRPFYTLNGEGDTVVVSAGLSTQNTSFGISGQPVQLDFANKELAALLNVNGKLGSATNVVSTDANGAASFTVIVPNNLTADQKAALNNKKLVATLTETLTGKTQEIQFNVQSTKAAIDLIAITSEPLNLNGGETQVEVIAQDSQENVIAGQTVFLALPAAIAEQGVRLVSGKEQTTNNSGVASYTLAVPAGLTQAQKDAIGSSFVVALSAADKNGNIATQTSTVTTTTPAATGTTENLTIGANKVVNTKGDSFKVFVRVADEDGAVNGRVVRLNVDDPIKTGVTVANGTATTNSDGVATFDLTLEAGANVNQALLENGIKLTATTTTAENTTLEQNYIVAVDTSTIDNYQILVTSDKSTLTTGGDQTNAVLRVTDSNGGILAGVPVQLSIANLVASGAALTTPSMVTTDANGKIDVGVLLAANSINARLNHDIDIEAKIVTPTYDVNGDVSLEVREQKTLSLSAVGTQVDIAASKTKLQDNEAITITTTVIDGAAQAISNAAMELIDADGDLIAPMATATTNSDGQAVFEVSEDQLTFDNNGNLQVYARALGEGKINTQRSVISINLVKVSQAGISFIDINDVYDVTTPQTINVQIRTDSPAQAQALIGQSLEVQTTLGTFANNDVITTKQIAADNVAGNIITVPVTLTSELAGTSVLQATVLGLTLQNGQPRYQTTIDTRFRATTPTKMLFQPVKSVITPGSSTEVVATVKDKNDVPVEGQTVVFSRAADSSAGRLSAATAITDSKGEARVVYQANASSPIGGVVINARLLNDPTSIGTKTTNITVSKEAVYTTLAFANKLSSDDIYYTVQGSISVMDGSGRAVADKEVSIKSYATQYAQGRVCLLNSNITYQKANEIEFDENGNVIKVTTPEPQTKSEAIPVFLQSGWKPTEDSNYNYTLDKDSTINEDSNNNGSLEAINPVAIIGGTVSDDGYTFVTDSEGRADFSIRYPMRYSNWVKVRFDATTFLNGSENMQSINYRLPSAESDLSINSSSLETPWIDNASPFGVGGAACVDSMNVTVNENTSRTRVVLSPYTPNYNVQIDGEITLNKSSQGYNSYIIDFSKAYEIGSTVTVNNNGFGFSKVISVD